MTRRAIFRGRLEGTQAAPLTPPFFAKIGHLTLCKKNAQNHAHWLWKLHSFSTSESAHPPQTPTVSTGAKVLLVLNSGAPSPPFFFYSWIRPCQLSPSRGSREEILGAPNWWRGGVRATFFNFASGCQNESLAGPLGVQSPGYAPETGNSMQRNGYAGSPGGHSTFFWWVCAARVSYIPIPSF